jgi:hypothetical protein
MPIINEIYEDDPSKNRTVDTETGFYLKLQQQHTLSRSVFFNIFEESGGSMSLECESYSVTTKEQQEKKISQKYCRLDSIRISKNFKFIPNKELIERLIIGFGGYYRKGEREHGYTEIVTVEFSERALGQLQALGCDNV